MKSSCGPFELLAQYKKCLPSGRKAGQRWLFSLRDISNFEIVSVFPPAAETRSNGDVVLGVKTIVPSEPQAPPRAFATSHKLCGGPPSALIFFSLPLAKNPNSCPSADQNGYMASSVPARACAVKAVSGRTYRRILPFSSRAVNTSRVPSGDSTGGPEEGSMVTKDVPGGGRIAERTICSGCDGFIR